MAQYGIDIRRCRESVVVLDNLNKQIVTSLDTLEIDAEASLQSWDGAAKLSYRQCKASWDASAAEMPQLLTTARIALEDILNNIELTESNGEQMWQGTGIGRR